jgi:hypothetical protein
MFSLKIDSRDRDIDRLQRIQDNDRTGDLIKLEAKLKSNEKIITHQNAQVNRENILILTPLLLLYKIEFLHENNRALERRLQELTDLKRDLSNKQLEERLKNDDLLRDLKDIDRLARKVQADKQYTVEAADRELTEAKVSFERKNRFYLIKYLISD